MRIMRIGAVFLFLGLCLGLLSAPAQSAEKSFHWLCLGRNGVVGDCLVFGSCCASHLHERDENEHMTFERQLKDSPHALRLKTGEKRFYDPITGFYYKAN